MAFSVGGLLLGLINEIRINLPLSQELIDRIDAALGPEEYRTGLIRDALRRELAAALDAGAAVRNRLEGLLSAGEVAARASRPD
jgi:hypothetical protein